MLEGDILKSQNNNRNLDVNLKESGEKKLFFPTGSLNYLDMKIF